VTETKFFFNKMLPIEDPARLGEGLFEICKEFKIPYSGVSKLAISYARQGLNIEEILKLVRIDVSNGR
jgi:hypothetical protein